MLSKPHKWLRDGPAWKTWPTALFLFPFALIVGIGFLFLCFLYVIHDIVLSLIDLMIQPEQEAPND